MNKVSMTITLPQSTRDTLRTIAAKRNLDTPATVVTASELASQLVVSALSEEMLDVQEC